MTNAIKTVAPQFRGIYAPKHDAAIFARREMPARCKLERRVVWNLLKHLAANGWKCYVAFDGDDSYTSKHPDGHEGSLWEARSLDPLTHEQVMDVVFNLDEVSVRFGRDGGDLHGVFLVLGNGVDCIADWNYTESDPDGFSAVMEAFDAYAYE